MTSGHTQSRCPTRLTVYVCPLTWPAPSPGALQVRHARNSLSAALSSAKDMADTDTAVELAIEAWAKFSAVPAGVQCAWGEGGGVGGRARDGGEGLVPVTYCTINMLCSGLFGD